MSKSLLAELSDRALADLLAPPKRKPAPSVIALTWCPTCRGWMREGSAARGACVDCDTPTPNGPSRSPSRP